MITIILKIHFLLLHRQTNELQPTKSQGFFQLLQFLHLVEF